MQERIQDTSAPWTGEEVKKSDRERERASEKRKEEEGRWPGIEQTSKSSSRFEEKENKKTFSFWRVSRAFAPLSDRASGSGT